MREDDWITTADAATLIGVTPRRIRQLARSGTLRLWQINPRLLLVDHASAARYRDSDRQRGPRRANRPDKNSGDT